MKKLILFLSIVMVIAGSFWWYLHSPKDYELTYLLDDAEITERYEKSSQYYFFTIKKEDHSFYYSIPMDYKFHRKKITKVITEANDKTICITPKIGDLKIDTICHNGEEYLDIALTELKQQEEAKKINSYQNITIYNQKYHYFIWNNKGFTDIKNNKEYSFLESEMYANSLTYQWRDYLLVPDYDEPRKFNTFYILDSSKEKVEEWEIPYEISFDSYFMGDVNGKIYLFDTKEKCQYAIDIENRKIEITSDQEGGVVYQNKWTHKPLNELAYYPETFTYEKQYNFEVKDNTLFMHYYQSNIQIKLSNQKIDHIIYMTDKVIYYLVDENLYGYEMGIGEQLLLTNFEWKFSYLNKIFVFD